MLEAIVPTAAVLRGGGILYTAILLGITLVKSGKWTFQGKVRCISLVLLLIALIAAMLHHLDYWFTTVGAPKWRGTVDRLTIRPVYRYCHCYILSISVSSTSFTSLGVN